MKTTSIFGALPKTQIRAEKSPATERIELFIRLGEEIVIGFDTEPIAPSSYQPRTCWMELGDAERLLDQLLYAGVRPTAAVDRVDRDLQMAQLRAHLADMRRIAFEALQLAKPE